MSESLWFAVAVGASVVVVIVLVLVAVLLAFERAFIPRGPFRIAFEGGSRAALSVSPRGSLLANLGEEGILLPSACGGAGTCGLCKVRVVDGGSEPLPTERALLTRADVAEGWRLACQLKVRRDLVVALPAGALSAKQLTCTVQSVRDVATFIREIALALPPGDRLEFEPGSFVQVHIPKYGPLHFADLALDPRCHDAWQAAGFRRLTAASSEPTTRAYSLANAPAESERLVLNVRIAVPPRDQPSAPPGVGSSYLYGLKSGDSVTLSGPFGEFHIADSEREMVYIGGGAGMAPLRSHIVHLLGTAGTERRISYWYGARSRREVFYDEELRALAEAHPNFSFHVALSEPLPEDDWHGDVGFIHEVVRRRYLAEHSAPDEIEYYLCGPPPMLSAVRQMLDGLGVPPEQIRFDDFGS